MALVLAEPDPFMVLMHLILRHLQDLKAVTVLGIAFFTNFFILAPPFRLLAYNFISTPANYDRLSIISFTTALHQFVSQSTNTFALAPWRSVAKALTSASADM